jgi:hypothetical protein
MPKKKTPEILGLNILYSPELTDRESVRAFVHGARFEQLEYAVLVAMETRASKLGLQAASWILSDMCALARAAAGPDAVPLVVEEGNRFPEGGGSIDATPHQYVKALTALAADLLRDDFGLDTQTEVLSLVAEISQRALESEAA